MKIALISKDLDLDSKKNISLKNDIDSHVCHASVASSSSISIACTSSIIENDICMLKKSVDYLGSTLSQCAMKYTRLESMFRKKQVPFKHAHHTRHTHVTFTLITLCMLMCIHVHVDVRATLLNFVMIGYMIQI